MHSGVTTRGRAVVIRKSRQWRCTKCRKNASDCGHIDSLLAHLTEHGTVDLKDLEDVDTEDGDEKEAQPHHSDLRRHKYNILSPSTGALHSHQGLVTCQYRATSSITYSFRKWAARIATHSHASHTYMPMQRRQVPVQRTLSCVSISVGCDSCCGCRGTPA